MSKGDISGKIIIITGASSGIGKATAITMANKGARIVLASRRKDELREVADEIVKNGGEALIIPTDVTKQDQVADLINQTISQMGRIDILIANAGEYIRCPIDKLTVDIVERSMRINFYGGLYPILAVLPHMKSQGTGHIIIVTSMGGKKGVPPDGPYIAAKFALTGFSEVLRQELKNYSIYVSTILPGRVDTPMIKNLKFQLISNKITPEAVANSIVNAIRYHKAEVIIPFRGRFLHIANAISPRIGDWAIQFFQLEGWE
jgi:short-subunit dehydrogenase